MARITVLLDSDEAAQGFQRGIEYVNEASVQVEEVDVSKVVLRDEDRDEDKVIDLS